jgi:hypothetical protein
MDRSFRRIEHELTMAERMYKRLPGRSYGIASISSLWEADDHLLFVQSYRVSETYKRFFHRDIHAMIVCRTRTGMEITFILGLIAAALGLGALLFPSDAVTYTVATFAVLFALFALINFLRGPTCRCTLQTTVQIQTLPSLGRLRNARKVLLRLQPKIEAAQGKPAAS